MLWDEPKFWVAAAFFLLIILSYRKVGSILARALDSRAVKIKAELDEARRLREEAEAVLAQYKQKQKEYLKEAENILLDARRDADRLRAHAETELKESMDTRMKHAVEKIAQEESKAIADVRDHVVDISLAAAKSIIADQLANLSQDELLKLALADIDRKIH